MNKKFSKKLAVGIGLLATLGITNSCVRDEQPATTEITRYTSNDVKSYADLFKVFWTVMDQRYNYFYEQKRKDGMDWNAIYAKYYPKFAALKTFGGGAGVTDKDRQDEAELARSYFEEIVNPIIDRHFNVKVTMPYTNSGVNYTYTFWGGMNDDVSNIYNFDAKYAYMKDRLVGNTILNNNFLLAGFLKSNPDIYYFSFKQFALTTNFKIDPLDKYLSPDPGNNLVLTVADIEKSEELNAIKDPAQREKVKNFTINILNQWNSFPLSDDVKAFNAYIPTFKNTEILSPDFLALTTRLLAKSKQLVAYGSASTYAPVLTAETAPYISWFMSKMADHATWGYRLTQFQTAAQDILNKAPFYTYFLNPLHRGDIKKLIIDVRGNGGGAVLDARFFSDRFITKSAISSYQRIKEGNGEFNYTPWTPITVTPHKFGLPGDIPITVLTDKGSASMSEMSTLMWKSQGSQVITVGDYSAGATAGLGTPDDFNGGTREKIAGYLEFYMPLMATKLPNGEVIEGVGIKPDIPVTPPTNEELALMKSSPKTFVDRVIDAAVKYLTTK